MLYTAVFHVILVSPKKKNIGSHAGIYANPYTHLLRQKQTEVDLQMQTL